jgi:hypothetical protein
MEGILYGKTKETHRGKEKAIGAFSELYDIKGAATFKRR